MQSDNSGFPFNLRRPFLILPRCPFLLKLKARGYLEPLDLDPTVCLFDHGLLKPKFSGSLDFNRRVHISVCIRTIRSPRQS